jgi:pimeloyl-ACP methyl ester carboxylesterase
VIERYLQIRTATVAGYLPSGELGYLTDVTGLLQLWRVARDGFHEQVTFAGERVTAALPSPSEERWVIARDSGGNERHALFSVGPGGSPELPLSDDPEAIHVPGAFSPDGTLLAFTHTGRNGVDFDVAVVAASGSERRELAQPGGWSHVVDWSEHGLLVQRANTPFDHDLLRVDPDSGAVSPLTPHDGEIAFDSARLLADGSVLCACDAGSEFARLAVLRPGASPELLTPDDADVELVALDATRTHRAWVINRGGESEAWLDGRRLEGLPGGVVSGTAFSPDGSLTVTAGPPDDSTDVWMASPAVGRRTRSAVGGLDRSTFIRPVLEQVESFDGLRIPYLRFGAAGRPTLCWVHGGPESQFRPQMAPVIQYLCAEGITVAAPNVRGSTGYGRSYHHLDDVGRRLDSVADLAALARALGAGAGTPVGVMGGSYGGYMTMAAITEHPDLWRCAVNIVGIVNFVTFLERTGAYRRALREAEYGSLERDREFLESISPIRKVDRIACPLMIIHGANDPRVPVGEAEQVVEALRARNADVEYLRYEDEGHGITRLSNRLDCYPRVAAFLRAHLLAAR